MRIKRESFCRVGKVSVQQRKLKRKKLFHLNVSIQQEQTLCNLIMILLFGIAFILTHILRLKLHRKNFFNLLVKNVFQKNFCQKNSLFEFVLEEKRIFICSKLFFSNILYSSKFGENKEKIATIYPKILGIILI